MTIPVAVVEAELNVVAVSVLHLHTMVVTALVSCVLPSISVLNFR